MSMMWKDSIYNVWYGPTCFPMDDLRRLYNDGLNILKFIGEYCTLEEFSEGTHWNIPRENDFRNYWCLIAYDLRYQTEERYAKVLILVTKDYKNVYLMDKDGNQCQKGDKYYDYIVNEVFPPEYKNILMFL